MSLDLSPALRTALIAEPTISGLLTEYLGEPAVFTRRPVPTDAVMPFIVVSEDVAITDGDGLDSDRPIPVRDILIYGDQPDQYRTIEQIGYAVRDLFHRQKGSIISADYDILDVRATGPTASPTSDQEIIGRMVELTILTRRK